MHYPWLIVDGYSLLHRDEGLSRVLSRDLGLARQRLVRQLEEVAACFADRTTVVFDGRHGETAGEFAGCPVEVIFSPRHLTADTVVERLVHDAPDPDGILVITSDRMERETVAAAGAHTLACGEFLEACRRQRDTHAERATREAKGERKTTLGDFFPD